MPARRKSKEPRVGGHSHYSHPSTPTGQTHVIYPTSLSASRNPTVVTSSVSVGDVDKTRSIENAVFSHISAIRALGRTRVNTREIAVALSLSIDDVHWAIARLQEKGVKVAG